MQRVEKAIETGRCAIAVSGSLLRDPEVMLALSERAALSPMALAGPAVAPVIPIGPDGIAPAIAQPGGVIVLIEPEGADLSGLRRLGALLQRGQHQPEVVVVARSYNPFAFGGALTGLTVDHEKGRGKAFIQALPEPPAGLERPEVSLAIAKAKKKGGDIAAPRFCFVGREEEQASLVEMLSTGGSIVVSGPRGAGRHQLVEHAIAATERTRLPDVWLGWGTGFDALISRIALAAKEAGDSTLSDLLVAEHTPVQAIAAAKATLASEALAGKVLVIHRLEFGLGRDNDFFRKGQLEMLLESILTQPASMPIVFVSMRQPRFHREGAGEALRRIELQGIKGRFLHEIFEANKAIEFPRDKYGPISDRLHGHPLAARTFAVATRVRQDGEALVDDPKFMKMDAFEDNSALRKHLGKRVEKLPRPLRAVLAMISHFAEPVDGNVLSDLRVNRKSRLELLSLGLLDMYGTLEQRRYRVHPLVRSHLSWREVSDFDTCSEIAEYYQHLARRAEGIAKQALEHQQNRYAVAGRLLRLRPRPELPDHDAWLESITGMLRGRTPRFDLVDQRLNECLKQNPANADAWILKIELAAASENKVEAVEAVLAEAVEKAPVPELFHQAASFCLSRRARNRAIPILERGIALFPDESRLRTRLGAVLLRQGRRNEGIEHLTNAMIADPMLPDPYGLLGMAKRDEGPEALVEAEQLLREAVRLAPGDPVQTARLADLLLERARVDLEHQKDLRTEAAAMLDEGIRGERRAPEACLLLATLLREEGNDLERSAWLLKQSRKLTDRNHERSRRISVERALLDMAQGNIEQAERTIRQRIDKDPTHARAFAALGHILEVREQYIPAYAEYQRAKERSSQHSLEYQHYDLQLNRVQAIIEAQAAGLLEPSAAAGAPGAAPASPAPDAGAAVAATPEAGATSADVSALLDAQGAGSTSPATAAPVPTSPFAAPVTATPPAPVPPAPVPPAPVPPAPVPPAPTPVTATPPAPVPPAPVPPAPVPASEAPTPDVAPARTAEPSAHPFAAAPTSVPNPFDPTPSTDPTDGG